MADKTIDQLTDGGNIQTGDEIPVVRNNTDFKVNANSILLRLDNLEISQGKNKGTFANQTLLPTATNGDYAFVISTTSTWIYNNTWVDAEQDLRDAFLNKNNNLSELTDKAIARDNLDVYDKIHIDNIDNYYENRVTALETNKVDKITGKGLSTNDFDNDYKSQVDQNTTNRHNHTNKALLDTYTQTEVDLGDAVLKKHTHSNKTILDNITASYTIEEQTKLIGIEVQATKNKTDAFLLDRQNHTGEQAISTITNLNTELASKQPMITQGTVAQYFKGDLSLSNFADDSRSAVINDNISASNTTYSSNEINNRINKLPVGVGSGVTYYLTATESSIVGYDNMTLTPDTNAEVIESVVVNNNKVLIDTYISGQALNRNVLDAGIWTFNLWGTVSNNNGQSYFIIDVYLRTDTGTETLLFTANSTVLNTGFTLTNTEIVHEAINTNLTDYLVIKISGFTTRSTDTTINLYHSGEIHYSHIHTPLIHQHNNLVGLQGGNTNERYHLTNSQYINATQFANTSQGGLLSSSDWNSFNNKADQTNTYTKTQIDTALNTKVDKITGKGLSTEDYTTDEKSKVGNLPNNTIGELNAKQNSTDNLLNTVDKTIVGAINENKTNIDLKADKITTYTKTETDNLLNQKLNTSLKGQANGLAELDATGKVPSNQLPSFVDDVLEYDNIALFPTIGETGKIYVAKDTNIIYRWSGTQYTEISSSLALGETSSTAYRGDRGKTAYDHSQIVNANPHNTSKADIGLSNVVNVDTTTTANITDSLNKRFVSDTEKTKIENTYTKTDTDNLLLNKVDKVTGKGLSTNDLTDTLKSNYDNAFTNSHTHSNKTLLDTYTQTEANLSDAVSKKHEHTNKAILDNTTASFTTAQETKLTGIQTGATANSTDAQLRDRSTHTGTQLANTISDFQAQVSANTDISTIKTGKNIKAWFISGGTNGSGNDTNNGYKSDNAFLTLSKLNTTMGNTGEQAVFLPSQLTESATFAQLNAEFTGHNASHRGTCGTSGTITSNNSVSGSQTYSYLSIGTFAKTGAGYVTMIDVAVSTGFSDSSSGTLDAYNLIFNATTPISITGSGVKNFYNQRGGIFTINNASAQVNIITNDYISQFTLTTGLMSLRNTIVYIAQGTTFTIGASGATFVAENVRFLYPDNTVAKINIPTGCNYSLQLNCIFDRVNSTLNGTDISSLYQGYFANVATKNINFTNLTANTILATDVNKNAQSLSTATYPSLTELSYIKGVNSSIQTQINTKENTITSGTSTQYYRGDKTFQTLDKNAVGLSNIDNTSDLNKPISTATQTALDLKANQLTTYTKTEVDTALNLKAPIASPTFTGIPAVPTAPAGTNTTQIASTQYVKNEISSVIASLDVMIFKGVIDASTNPNYPSADAGHTYKISVAGKIGGASGINVEIGDLLICLVDGSASGTQATVGANWNISQVNIDGAVTSIETVTTDNDFVLFSGTSGKNIKKTTLANYKTLLSLSKSDVGLSNVDNTSDLNKPISTATQTALNTKENTIIAGTTTQYYRGDKTFQSLDKVAVGLANVDNTADISKNVLSATKFTTVRTINGVSFDGTANITITDSTKVDKTQTIAGTALSGNITQDQITGLSTTGIIKRTGANTLATAVAGTDYESPITTLSIAKGGTNSSTALTGNKVIVSNGTQIIESSISTTNLSSLDTTTSITSQLSSKEPAFTKNTAFNKNFGNTIGTVCQGNDARLGTKDIDETNIGNGKIQVYNSTSGKLEYQTPSSGATNLSIANKTSITLDIASDTGNDATIPQATITEAGLLSSSDKVKLNNISGINSGDESSTTIYDKFSAQFVAGTNISIDKNNTAKTLTFNSTATGGHTIEDYTITSFPNRTKLRFMGGGDTTVYAEDDIANNRTNVWISSTSSGGGITWPVETTITTNTTLSANGSYLIDLTSNSITATLPSNPSNNTIIWLKVKKYINTNTFTINLNTVNKKYDYYYSDNTALAIDTISGDGLLQITNSDANVYYDDFTLRYKTDKWIITNKTLIS